MASMVRKQIYLTVDQDRRLRQAAKRNRRSEADIIREALDRGLGGAEVGDLANDPLWGLVGIGADGPADLSESVDLVLYGAKKK